MRTAYLQKNNELKKAFVKLREIIMDGLCHGFFECTVSCEIGNGHKRHLIIRGGKSYKYIIPEEDLEK